MSDAGTIILRISFRLLPTSDGGRQTPISSGYRPNWWVGNMRDGVRTYTDGQVALEGVSLLLPGGAAGALLQPLHPQYWRHVRAGMRIEAYEGSRLIGVAMVEEVG